MATYHIIMSDQKQRNIAGSSAAEAIMKALNRNRQLTVLKVWLGGYEGDLFGQTGIINFEVPPHQALPPKPKPTQEDMEDDE